MPSRLLFSCALALALGCSSSSLKVAAGGGLAEDSSGALGVDGRKVPLAPTGCDGAGKFLHKTATGWACDPVDLSDVTGQLGDLRTEVAMLSDSVAQLQAKNDALTDQVTNLVSADCPHGWLRDATETGFTLCTKAVGGATDEVVRVGDFWIDRYELSTCGGDLGANDANGTTAVACSVSGVPPQGDISWFQAARLCANAGKHLCSNGEWSAAVLGTTDPGAWPVVPAADVPGPDQPCSGEDAGAGPCNTCSNGLRLTGLGTQCRSRFGAEDMIGNATEWVADWSAGFFAGEYASTHAPILLPSDDWRPWPDGFGGDGTHAFDSVSLFSGSYHTGLPAPLMRGGRFVDGHFAGAFAVNSNLAAADKSGEVGARCCL